MTVSEPGSAPLIGDEQRTEEYHEMEERQGTEGSRLLGPPHGLVG
jgi:hypothetical protein